MSSAPFDVSVVAEKLKLLLKDKTLVFVGTSAEYSKLTDLTSTPRRLQLMCYLAKKHPTIDP
ncbi:hypothetical protein PT273_08755 [Orbaceae bacterium ESL0727]|nr:hypothetical protein [Orbaceae bacterium ESL0727]